MAVRERIDKVQRHLVEYGMDGWLLYDFQKRNELAWDFLEIPSDKHLTRRFFYWIPAHGNPVRIVHEIEGGALDHLPGEKLVYLRWQTLEALLNELLRSAKIVAMEYSPRCAIPYISRVDGGTVDLIRSCGVEVVSSGPFLQHYTSVLNDGQVQSLIEAGAVLEEVVEGAWKWIAQSLRTEQEVTDYGVVQWIAQKFADAGCETEALPHCAVNADSADPPLYADPREGAAYSKGGFYSDRSVV